MRVGKTVYYFKVFIQRCAPGPVRDGCIRRLPGSASVAGRMFLNHCLNGRGLLRRKRALEQTVSCKRYALSVRGSALREYSLGEGLCRLHMLEGVHP